MNKILELKQAAEQLVIDSEELDAAEKELSSWQDYDLRRSDGSGRQDALHEERGQELQDRVWLAKRKFESQKKLVSTLATAV